MMEEENNLDLHYKCLILDHDDTAVKSTPEIHYPSFAEALEQLRPNERPVTYQEFVKYCFHPGFSALCTNIMQFTEEEQQKQQQIWKRYTSSATPDFYELFVETITEFKRKGGIITVVSHSEKDKIERDYASHCGFLPDAVFGWELPEHQRKPNAYPIREILKRFHIPEHAALVLDDSKPGLDMANSCNVDFASAGWSHSIPEIKNQMKKESLYYFETVQQFNQLVLQNMPVE